MTKKLVERVLHLTSSEDKVEEIPEEIQRIGTDSLKIIWKISQDIAQVRIDKMTEQYQQCEMKIIAQKQEAEKKVEILTQQLKVAVENNESLHRENKSLQVDSNSKAVELKSARDQIAILQEENVQKSTEVINLTEELGRIRERTEHFEKRLHEMEYQIEQDRNALQELKNESSVSAYARDRLTKDMRSLTGQLEQSQQQLKTEQTRAAIDNALVKELREDIKKKEESISRARDEKREVKEKLELEVNARVILENKIAALTARNESQERAYKDTINKLEKELSAVRDESTVVRQRLIKAESGLEREKKAIERLESKLIGNAGINRN
jgi:chromosome segregation ATPase